jgi:3-hydroxyisobutyrate dehydrogenase
MEITRVGFIGLGIMGAPMAENLIKSGFQVTAFNRTPDKTQRLQEKGATIVDCPASVAEKCKVIITIVSDTPDVEEVIVGTKGIIEKIQPGSIVIDMSTASPQMEKAICKQLEQKGATLIDAPVSGGDVGAQNATLAIMAGGKREAFDHVMPVFQAMGKSITYCGDSGSGQLTKLCNQILVSLNLLAVSEAVSFARKNGLDPNIMIDAVKGGAAGSWQLTNLGPKIASEDFAPGFMIDLMQKDLRLVLEAGNSAHLVLFGTSLVQQLFNSAQAVGLGRKGTQALAKVVFELSNTK